MQINTVLCRFILTRALGSLSSVRAARNENAKHDEKAPSRERDVKAEGPGSTPEDKVRALAKAEKVDPNPSFPNEESNTNTLFDTNDLTNAITENEMQMDNPTPSPSEKSSPLIQGIPLINASAMEPADLAHSVEIALPNEEPNTNTLFDTNDLTNAITENEMQIDNPTTSPSEKSTPLIQGIPLINASAMEPADLVHSVEIFNVISGPLSDSSEHNESRTFFADVQSSIIFFGSASEEKNIQSHRALQYGLIGASTLLVVLLIGLLAILRRKATARKRAELSASAMDETSVDSMSI